MTAPHMPTLPSGAGFAAYPLQQTDMWNPISLRMESGHVEIRARTDKPVYQWQLVGENLNARDIDVMRGFLYDRKGGGNFWYWDNPLPIPSPYDAPTTSATTSGAIAGRTLYVTYAWGDGTNKTEDSQESTEVVAANDLLTVTPNKFPPGVTQAEVYFGTVSGTLYWVGSMSTTGGTWTEPYSTVDADSNSGQKVLQIAATTNFEAGQSILIGVGTARVETKIIDTVQAGVSITMTANLDYTHTAVQADKAYISPDTGTSPLTANALVDVEFKVRQVGEPAVTLIGTGVYSMVIGIEYMF